MLGKLKRMSVSKAFPKSVQLNLRMINQSVFVILTEKSRVHVRG